MRYPSWVAAAVTAEQQRGDQDESKRRDERQPDQDQVAALHMHVLSHRSPY
jgi:hypothetical protein